MHKCMMAAIKDIQTDLNSIEVPTCEWFYSTWERELYHYNEGVFEAHSAMEGYDNFFHKHHHLKVFPPDAMAVEVDICKELIAFLTIYPQEAFWTEITNQKEIERLLHHTYWEGGFSHHHIKWQC